MDAKHTAAMRAEFMAWVRDRGCDTDGAWSAWQAASAGKAELLAVAQKFVDTIHSVEQRCMAADGPVTPTHQEITDAELSAVYEAARAAIAKATS